MQLQGPVKATTFEHVVHKSRHALGNLQAAGQSGTVGKRIIADVLQVLRQMQAAIQIGTELKTVVANVLQPGGQFQLTGKLAILERTAIPILLLPVPQPFQRRGQGECPRERLAVYESTGIDIRHTLRNSQRTGKVLAAFEGGTIDYFQAVGQNQAVQALLASQCPFGYLVLIVRTALQGTRTIVEQRVRTGYLDLFQVEELQIVHRVAHEVKVHSVYLTGNLQVTQFTKILIGSKDGLPQMPRFRINDDVLLRRRIMRSKVRLPRRDGLSRQCEHILSCRTFLVHPDGEVMHPAGLISEIVSLLKGIVDSTDSQDEQLLPGRDRLWNDNGAVFTPMSVRDGSGLFGVPHGGHRPRSQVDGCIANGVLHQHHLFQPLPFTVCKALSFCQSHAGITHAVTE